MKPLIGITTDIIDVSVPGFPAVRNRVIQSQTYIENVINAGGVPVLLPPTTNPDPAIADQLALDQIARLDGVVLTGGDDIDMTPFGVANHPHAKLMHPLRQRHEFAILRAIDARSTPALGVCLGMQLMCVHNRGTLNQHLPDTLASAERHRHDTAHPVASAPNIATTFAPLPAGAVASNHHQGVDHPGRLRAIAFSDDGVIEAVDDPARPFFLGVQWHPERTSDPRLGVEIFQRLVLAATKR
jgi:putative glutamine amidotransferase